MNAKIITFAQTAINSRDNSISVSVSDDEVVQLDTSQIQISNDHKQQPTMNYLKLFPRKKDSILDDSLITYNDNPTDLDEGGKISD